MMCFSLLQQGCTTTPRSHEHTYFSYIYRRILSCTNTYTHTHTNNNNNKHENFLNLSLVSELHMGDPYEGSFRVECVSRAAGLQSTTACMHTFILSSSVTPTHPKKTTGTPSHTHTQEEFVRVHTRRRKRGTDKPPSHTTHAHPKSGTVIFSFSRKKKAQQEEQTSDRLLVGVQKRRAQECVVEGRGFHRHVDVCPWPPISSLSFSRFFFVPGAERIPIQSVNRFHWGGLPRHEIPKFRMYEAYRKKRL